MIPSEYVLNYHHVWTPLFKESSHEAGMFGQGGVLTPVLQYSNMKYTNKAGKKPSERLAYKDHLLSFFAARRKEDGSGITYSKGEGYSLTNSAYPVHDFPKSAFMASFSGKASPRALTSMAQFISYWRSYKAIREGGDPPLVADIVDKYLGVDCNGFIGNYLQEKYAGVPVGPSTPEYVFKKKGEERVSPAEFQRDDVIVFEGFHHVAIIDSVADRSDDYAVCLVCESRSRDNGGPQMNWFKIEIKTDKGKRVPNKYKIKGRDDIDCVVKIKGT